MHCRLLLTGSCAVFTACTGGLSPIRVQPDSTPLPAKVRADVLDEVIIMRYGRISNWGQVDACSVYRALDRAPDFRERLGTTARSKLTDESAAACESADATTVVRGRWYVREITPRGPEEITVLVGVIGESGTHRETYVLDQGYGHNWWRLREVHTTNFSID